MGFGHLLADKKWGFGYIKKRKKSLFFHLSKISPIFEHQIYRKNGHRILPEPIFSVFWGVKKNVKKVTFLKSGLQKKLGFGRLGIQKKVINYSSFLKPLEVGLKDYHFFCVLGHFNAPIFSVLLAHPS